MTISRSLTLMLFALAQSACTGFKSTSESSSSRGCAGAECAVIASRFKATTGLAKQNQLYEAFKSCLGLSDAAVSAETKSTFETVKSSLSAEGRLEDLNAPMLMSQTQLAGAFCRDRINVETSAATSRFFTKFSLFASTSAPAASGTVTAGADLPAANTSSGPTFDDTIVKLARACWGREPLGFEIQKIRDLFNASTVGGKTDKGAALFLCTLTLSSPDVLIY